MEIAAAASLSNRPGVEVLQKLEIIIFLVREPFHTISVYTTVNAPAENFNLCYPGMRSSWCIHFDRFLDTVFVYGIILDKDYPISIDLSIFPSLHFHHN